ncbi:holin [Novisyntrophococcus fermenticellae]|uniref:holin n=1 Tax=Novisyntrophococcus fermenticellae TaxID=2068655 RepID=UPI001E5895F3|nr:holin [Novisyntrophococcus fermenticellae]
MKNRNLKEWLQKAGVRAVKTMAQAAIASIGAAAALGEVDWRYVASASLLAGVLSLLTSTAGIPEVPEITEGE